MSAFVLLIALEKTVLKVRYQPSRNRSRMKVNVYETQFDLREPSLRELNLVRLINSSIDSWPLRAKVLIALVSPN